MKLAIIGLPGAGRSTVFQALTGSALDPGQRAETQIAVVKVPDTRVDRLIELYAPKKTVHAQVEYLLPGLGGSKSDERSDQMAWSQVRDCDAFIVVVRNFSAYGLSDPQPEADFTAVNQELILTDLIAVEKRLERLALDRRRGKAIVREEQPLLEQCQAMLESETPLRREKTVAHAPALRGFAFLSAKPMLVLFNNSDEDDALPETPLTQHDSAMVIKGKLEQELGQMSAQEVQEFLSAYHLEATAKDRVIQKSYALIGLISFFTAGEKEVHAWTIPQGMTAVEAAGTIHSDMQRGFIRAEVLAYNDLMAVRSYSKARKEGTVRLEGKTYVVQDGDVVVIRFNV